MLKLDHVTMAASRLEALAGAFAAAGLSTDYRGIHSNGITHMSALGFRDGTCIEIFSVMRPGQPAPFWQEHVVYDGGPCGWWIQVDDLDGETQRLRELGLEVEGPHHRQRRLQGEGATIEWELAYLPGDAVRPLMIKDRTDRELRVQPSASVQAAAIEGVHTVVVGVSDLGAAVEEFGRLYDLCAPVQVVCGIDADIVYFPGSPVALAAPRGSDDVLAQRLAKLGPCPFAYLLSSHDFEAARSRFNLSEAEDWDGRALAWFKTPGLTSIGVLGV